MPGRRPGQTRDDVTGEPFTSGEPVFYHAPEPPTDGLSGDHQPAPDTLVIWWCPIHGNTRYVIGMGADRPPRCALARNLSGDPCGLEAPRTTYVREDLADHG